ncbi:MAG: PadR family transcriptional regulator [Bacteroidota bacterium]
MKGSYLGEFEEIVLLMVALLGDEAYGLSIRDAILEQSQRTAAIGAVHSALNRLEKKGFVESKMGDATGDRGGRRKRIFSVTASGKAALERSRELRNSLWNQIPELYWKGLKLQGLLWSS